MANSLSQNPSDGALTIVEHNGDFLLDSRVLAIRLEYEHKIILQSIRRHKERLEAKSSLLQNEAVKQRESRGATREVFYMLNERQCLILAGSLKKGSEADEWHDRLVDEFLAARAMVKRLQGQDPPVNIHKFSDMLQARAEKNLARVPEGYFAVLPQLFYQLWTLERFTGTLDEDAHMEISVGHYWRRYTVDHFHLPESEIIKYQHVLANGRIVEANAYKESMMPSFHKWLWTIYFPEFFPAYVDYRKSKLALPAPKTRRQLGR